MWLLDQKVFLEMQGLLKSGALAFSPESQKEFEALVAARRSQSGEFTAFDTGMYSVANGEANIVIAGPITAAPSYFSYMYSSRLCLYSDIILCALTAQSAEEVKNITLSIDSPGGTVEGLFDTLDVLNSITKPMTARVTGAATSAAYAIAATTEKIVATSRAREVGSIGVATRFFVYDDEVTITSTEAPDKRPDVRTEEGKAAVRRELDGIHDLFVEGIAQGRGVPEKKVNADFGRGATLLADEALKRGMIDEIEATVAKAPIAAISASGEDDQPKDEPMNKEELQAKHPEVFAEVMQLGVDKERDRVSAHLTMGEGMGAMDIAVKAVQDGSEMTATLTAQYTVAGMNKRETEDRIADEIDTAAGADNAGPAAEFADDYGDPSAAQFPFEPQAQAPAPTQQAAARPAKPRSQGSQRAQNQASAQVLKIVERTVGVQGGEQ